MFGQDRIRGLMAQAVYEELEPADRDALNSALANSESLRAEAQALGLLVERIPQETPEFTGDLLPAVRAGILEESAAFSLKKVHRIAAFAALALVLSGVGYVIAMRPPVAQAPSVAKSPASSELQSPLDMAILQAESLILERQYQKAYVTLSRALEADDQDPRTGETRQLMADLAYSELKWYPEAYANYEALRVRHRAEFQAKLEKNLLQINLLEEARGRDGSYASLLALDRARRDESISDLEELLANYPATYVASLAAEEMAALSAHLDGLQQGGVDWQVAAMESALARTTNPVARDQLKIEIGHLVSREMEDAERARALYEEVAESGITAVAELAQNSLERLEAEAQ